jgi:hypothetical protein
MSSPCNNCLVIIWICPSITKAFLCNSEFIDLPEAVLNKPTYLSIIEFPGKLNSENSAIGRIVKHFMTSLRFMFF